MECKIKTVSADSPVADFIIRYITHVSSVHSIGTLGTERVATNEFIAFFGDAKIGEITPERADAWCISLTNRFKQNTARTRICLMKMVFRYAVSIGVVKESPFDKIKIPRMVFSGRIVNDRVLHKFFLEFPLNMRRVLKLILNTGMRKTEAVMLDWSEVRGRKIILPPERTKNRKGRTIYLNSVARRCLGTRPASGTGRVFDFSPSYMNKFATAAWRKLKLGRLRIHDLRHIAATRHYEKNHDDYAMMDAFGWASLDSAQPYHHLTDARIRKSMDRMTYSV